MKIHPCLKCGACCAAFRVSFHWSETLTESYNVPVELSAKISPHIDAMNGTNQPKPRCVALQGVVSKSVACGIYERRPSCCRKFTASYEDGVHNSSCDEAREKWGLSPLTQRNWDVSKNRASEELSQVVVHI